MHTYSTLNIEGNIHYCMDKISGLMHQFLLYCSNIYIYIYIYILHMSKSETIRNRLLVINRLIENLKTPID